MNADEALVLHILNSYPEITSELLTTTTTTADYSGRAFTGTAFQAALAAGDVSHGGNTKGLCEIMVDYFKELPDGEVIMLEQFKALFTASLAYYRDKQAAEIERLTILRSGDEFCAQLQRAQTRLEFYQRALDTQDVQTICKVHAQAQEDNVFDQYVQVMDAIAAASDDEIEAIFDKPDADLGTSVSRLLKACRSTFTQHAHEEIIVNRNHLVKLFALC